MYHDGGLWLAQMCTGVTFLVIGIVGLKLLKRFED